MGYTDEIMKYDLLDANQEQELATRIQNGDIDALNTLVCANLRLVTKIAQQYKRNGVDLEDLVQAGNVGLMQAARNYKPSTGARFQTFAQFHIRHGMKDALSKMSGAVSMSIGTYGRHKEAWDTAQEIGENATEEQVAKKLGRRKKSNMSATIRGGGVKVSLHDKVDGDGKRTYLDVIEQEGVGSAIDEIIHEEQMKAMMESLSCLDREERYVIDSLFGLNGEGKKVLREIGDSLGKTAERVRQIKEMALGKMREAIAERMGD